MAWIVTAWKPAVLRETERESRRLRRAADRELEDTMAHLLELENLGAELREDVRRRRREQHPRASEPQPDATRARCGRARMRSSPLSELFRAT